MFASPISVRPGPVVERDGFCFADLLPDRRTGTVAGASAAESTA